MSRVLTFRSPRLSAPEQALADLELAQLDYFDRHPRRRLRLCWIDTPTLNAFMERGENTWRFSENRGWECEPWPRFPAGTSAFVIANYNACHRGRITLRVFAIVRGRALEMDSVPLLVDGLRRRRRSKGKAAA